VGARPHAHLSTTQRYLNPVTEDVIAELLAYQIGLAAGHITYPRCVDQHHVQRVVEQIVERSTR
jgi:hypothetical protein